MEVRRTLGKVHISTCKTGIAVNIYAQKALSTFHVFKM